MAETTGKKTQVAKESKQIRKTPRKTGAPVRYRSSYLVQSLTFSL